MNCPICTTVAAPAFSHTVRGNFAAQYMLCPTCDYMFVAKPTWLGEAYARPINITDTGYVMRNIYLSRKTLILFRYIFGKEMSKHTFLDYAGGYGVLTRIMRDYGLDYWNDDPYTENLFAYGFDYKKDAAGTEIAALTCFECFEHLPSPKVELEKMLALSKTIFFSTQLKPVGIVPDETWEYYGFNHGQHVSFYSTKTFAHIAQKYHLHYYTDGYNLHMLTNKKLSPYILRFINFLTKLQADLFIRKTLTSKTTSDHNRLVERGW